MELSNTEKDKPSLLLHICCIGCGIHVAEELGRDFSVRLYFYNPNIFPASEYEKRLKETKRVAEMMKLGLIIGAYDHGAWLGIIAGHETDPERGERCRLCYRDRLEKTAEKAAAEKADYFTTTLSVSPHKDARAIGAIGREAASRRGVKFLDRDFKKRDGFKKACAKSRELGLYRQDYCGCEFSVRNA